MQYLAFIIGIFLTVFFVWMTRKKDLFEKYNKYMIAIAVSLLIALSLEVFTFNFVSFERNNELQYAISFDTNTRQPSHEGNLSLIHI